MAFKQNAFTHEFIAELLFGWEFQLVSGCKNLPGPLVENILNQGVVFAGAKDQTDCRVVFSRANFTVVVDNIHFSATCGNGSMTGWNQIGHAPRGVFVHRLAHRKIGHAVCDQSRPGVSGR